MARPSSPSLASLAPMQAPPDKNACKAHADHRAPLTIDSGGPAKSATQRIAESASQRSDLERRVRGYLRDVLGGRHVGQRRIEEAGDLGAGPLRSAFVRALALTQDRNYYESMAARLEKQGTALNGTDERYLKRARQYRVLAATADDALNQLRQVYCQGEG